MTNREHLTQALAHLQAVRKTLNHRTRACECCGLRVFEDYMDKLVWDRLNALILKLERAQEVEGSWLDREPGV